MAAIQVYGMNPLEGEISVQGSKNGALPIMAGALLHKGTTVLYNVPDIEDTRCMTDILREIGCRCEKTGSRLVIDAAFVDRTEVPGKYVKAMRSSIILLGALLGRMKEGRCSFPGGCLIGARPVDLHLMVLEKLGAIIEEEDGQYKAEAFNGLKGCEIELSYPSVGATEQAVLAAVLADGVTVIHNAAKEPEISQLCHFLNGMGAVICGMETEHLMVQGVKKTSRQCMENRRGPDRGRDLQYGSYGSRGNISLKEVNTKQLKLPLELLRKAGANVREEEFSLHISMKDRPKALSVCTGPYPEFPTDLQSPFMAFLACAKGESRIREQVFEDRFGTAAALRKMGADITCKGKDAWVRGVYPLKGARVKALDLRGGAALAVAALGAEGKTVIEDCSHIVRGYEDICRDINALGGKISWMESDTG